VTAPAQNPAGTAATPGQAAPVAGAPAAGAAAAGTAAAAGKRSWMGPIAGLAAGLGLAALASHLGFGEAFANMMLIGLAVMAVLLVVGFVMRRQAAARMPAMAGAGAPMARSASPATGGSLIGSRIGSGLGASAAAAAGGTIPAGFDTAAFERNASAQFMALQEANDAGDLPRLRGYLTPEMFDLVAADIAERGGAAQKTEVFGLQTRVLDVVEEPAQYVVSVRFTGSVREQPGALPEDLDEVWHLAKPRFGEGGWVIAGIQQAGTAG
jgi:predicted lipid-binding transport protein (Tim44 family)